MTRLLAKFDAPASLLIFAPSHRDLYERKETPLSQYCRRRYGCLNFLFDIFMVLITSGLWIIWIFVREMRAR